VNYLKHISKLIKIKRRIQTNNLSRQDLSNQEAVAKLKELAEKSGTCMFCTNLSQFPHTSRPMALQAVDETEKCWFISST